MSEHADNGRHGQTPRHFDVKILRQDRPGTPSYWERHRVRYEHDMNVISVLMRVAEQSRTTDGREVAPVAWECNCLEEVCGACTMLINGKVRQACTALVDRLLEDNPAAVELRPMTKFPVVRDLVVSRSRMFHALKRVKAWIPVDGYYDMGSGPKQSPEDQESAYPLSQCMSCGCCLEACPQYAKVEVDERSGESAAERSQREQAAFDRAFIGPHAIGQVVLFNTHPTGRISAGERWDALMAEGGIQQCGNAQNCVAVCPKNIPLTTAIARAGRATTFRMFSKWFDR
jgi:succinate dehydrogenase / fumarate reductase iron-sulfur subunit